MKLSTLKSILQRTDDLSFYLENSTKIPAHFHITEIGLIEKNFIDCGGTIRNEKTINLQLWYSHDTEHRLSTQKFLEIIELSEKHLSIEDAEIEVEYQQETIGKFGLAHEEKGFVLTNKQTTCLATDSCGISSKPKIQLTQLGSTSSSCTPGSGCC